MVMVVVVRADRCLLHGIVFELWAVISRWGRDIPACVHDSIDTTE